MHGVRLLALSGLVLLTGVFPAWAEELVVSAAVSLRPVLAEAAKEFEQSNPGVRVQLNLAAQGVLIAQLQAGAPADALITADPQAMEQARGLGLIETATVRELSANTLVLAVPAGRGLAISSLEDLASPAVKRVALGNTETTAIGAYVKKLLEERGLWAKVEPKVLIGQTIMQVAAYVDKGEADAGFLFATEVLGRERTIQVPLVLGGASHFTTVAALVAASQKQRQAQGFLDFLASPQIQALFRKYGFTPVGQ